MYCMQKSIEQHDIERTVEEIRIFLSLIDENSNNSLRKLSLRTEHTHQDEDDTAFFCCLEEDIEEIKKALDAIRDRINKIA